MSIWVDISLKSKVLEWQGTYSLQRTRYCRLRLKLPKKIGPVHLSLDAVARRAGLSKGGLLYSFPTKAKLLEALVEQHVGEFDESLREEEAKRNHGPDSVVQACIEVYRAEFVCNEPEPSGILAAIANDPGFIEPIRRYNRQLWQRMKDNSEDPTLALIAYLTIEGLRSLKLFEMDVPSRDEQIEAIDRLRNLFERVDLNRASQPIDA